MTSTEREKRKAPRSNVQMESPGRTASSSGFLSIKTVVIGMLFIFGICSWQFVLILHHGDQQATGQAQEVLWRQLSVHEANLSALMQQQRDVQSLLVRLKDEVMAQQQEIQQATRDFDSVSKKTANKFAEEDHRLADVERETVSARKKLERQETHVSELEGVLSRFSREKREEEITRQRQAQKEEADKQRAALRGSTREQINEKMQREKQQLQLQQQQQQQQQKTQAQYGEQQGQPQQQQSKQLQQEEHQQKEQPRSASAVDPGEPVSNVEKSRHFESNDQQSTEDPQAQSSPSDKPDQLRPTPHVDESSSTAPKRVAKAADDEYLFPKEWLSRFSNQELEASAEEAEKWKDMTRNAALHAWNGYKDRAWGADEMKPVSGGAGRVWCSCGLQILDALSTLWVLGLHDQFDEAEKWVRESLRFDYPGTVSFFEITIRALGGLASAHALSGRDIFLQKARELADKLLPAFTNEPGFPKSQVTLATGQGADGWYQGTVLAEAGTVQLEFRYISQLTGDQRYAQKADKSMNAILQAEGGRGLVPWGLSRDSPPRFTNNDITFGAMGDSYYEYLLKMFLQTESSEPVWKDAWKRAMSRMMDRLIKKTPSGLTYIAEEHNGNIDPKMDHLACFVGGMLIYGARKLPASEVDSRWEDTAAGITETCYQMYHIQPSHLAAEASAFGPELQVWNNAAHYLLRPEAAEAIFYMFYFTGDPKYRRMAGEIIEAIETRTKTPYGYSAVADVRGEHPYLRDEMETFFIAETLKYLYLTFVPNPRKVLNLDEFVLTTEAHPLRIFRDSHQ